ncbi:MAG: hypothetical protein ABIH37_02990 [archaeon]
MKPIVNIYKPIGLSPLQAIEKFKIKHREYKKVKIGYAGRLDPMAEGVLICLVGDENKKIGQYMRFDKEYKAEILLGLKSDTNDVLGVVEKVGIGNLQKDMQGQAEVSNKGESPRSLSDTKSCKNISNLQTDKDEGSSSERDSNLKGLLDTKVKELKKKIKSLKGKYEQKIPKYSSYRIKGKPMFYYALKGKKVKEIKKEVEIKSVKINSIYNIGSNKLLRYVVEKISKVDGKFRQDEIVDRWKKVLDGKDEGDKRFVVVDVTISCSSGTYIRAIAEDVGGLLLSLKRTRVGKFDVRDSERV